MKNSKLIVSTTVAVSAILGIGAASAADMHVKAAPIVAPVLTWTGCYVGGNAGWIGGENRYSLAPSGNYLPPPGGAAPPNAAGTGDFLVDIAALSNTYNTHPSGGLIGAQIGCNLQNGRFIFGVEADWQWTSQRNSVNAAYAAFANLGNPAFTDAAHTEQVSTSLNSFGTFRGRAGFDFNQVFLYGTGGLAVGETHLERYEMTALVTEHLPRHLPRYLMGVGTPIDILECVHRGVDMFDCIIPSQLAQRGVVFTSRGKLKLRRSVYKLREEPLDADCECQTCSHYSRAYLHHLVKSDEVLGWHLLGLHNMTFYHRLLREMRESILRDEFTSYYEKKRFELVRADEENPGHSPKKAKTAPPARLGDYEMHRSAQGFYSIRQISSGEVMHSVTAPSEEANKLYIEQSFLAARLLKREAAAAELVIWDVGLGAGSNAMAAIHCFEKGYAAQGENALRPLRLVSFERDLDALTLAVKHSRCFPLLRHGAPFKILEHGAWQHSSSLLQWKLLKGDFRGLIESAETPDLIFYDPFSYKTDAALWSAAIFERIFQLCAPKAVELYTYSASTAVRTALLTAGFFVAQGAGTGPKSATTIAFTRAAAAGAHPASPSLLGQEWLSRWRRSGAKFPPELSDQDKPYFESLIESHRQFADDFAKSR